MKYQAIGLAFELLALSGMPQLWRRLSRARGVIFTLHRVLPEPPADFSPNAILQVTPDFLDAAIVETRRRGFDIVSMDEALARLRAPHKPRPFVVFTFDDAYRDNLEYALPIMRKHQAPFTLYVPTALVDGGGEVWWQALEDIVAMRDVLDLGTAGLGSDVEIRSLDQKHKVYADLYAAMRAMPEPDRVELIRDLAGQAGLDLKAHCRSLIMDWPELQIFADEPLCTLGAHTVHHYELAKLDEAEARGEIAQSVKIIDARFAGKPAHLSYPIGSRIAAGPREYGLARALGFGSAVTTIPGGLFPRHAEAPFALPRISLNGRFQQKRYLNVFLTGGLFSLLGRA